MDSQNNFDVIVLGGGVIGCSIAYYLSKERLRVLVLEKESVGSQASSGAVGLLSVDSHPFSDDNFRQAALFCRKAYADLSVDFKARYGNDLAYEQCGILRVAKTPEDLEVIRKEALWHQKNVAQVQELSADEILSRWPQIAGKLVGGVFYSHDAQVTSSRVVEGLAQAAKELGVIFKENAIVTHFESKDSTINCVEANKERYFAKHFILATGSWLGRLSHFFGFEIPMEPIRGQLLILQMKERLLPMPVTVGGAEYYYLVPKQDQHLYAGTTLEKAGFDSVTTEDALAKIASEVTDLVPQVSSLSVRGSWAGLRPATPDDLPVLGRMPNFKNLWAGGGHYRKGILLAPWTGQTMADLILNRKPSISLESFSPARFQVLENRP